MLVFARSSCEADFEDKVLLGLYFILKLVEQDPQCFSPTLVVLNSHSSWISSFINEGQL